MTKVIAINDQNDIYLDNTNNIAIATGALAVQQAAQTATLAQLEEMILFTLRGMPARQAVWVGSPNYAVYQAAVVSAIQSIYGVNAVTSITVSQQGDTLSYVAIIDSIYGELTING